LIETIKKHTHDCCFYSLVVGSELHVGSSSLILFFFRVVRNKPPIGKLRVTIVEGAALAARNLKGKSDPYCEVYIGSQEHRTSVAAGTLNPKWNASMQFLVKDLQQDVLCLTVLNRDYFSPNEFLGRTEVRVSDIVEDCKLYRGPLLKKLALHEVESGEILLKLDLQLFD